MAVKRSAKVKDAVVVKNLKKSYGSVQVLKGISFSVKSGSILAVLGPNGAGKTTTIRILSTLLAPDSGSAKVNGYDIAAEGSGVRASIGLTGQYAAVDEYLTGEENLHMMGRLYRLTIADTKRRADQLVELLDLTEAAKRPVKTYSGGMRRKLDLAMSMIASPPIIFLDEPTTGLDPRSRMALWDTIRLLANGGITIVLTTQYMDEADHLADNILVIDDGRIIAEGTPDLLKSQIGSDRLEITISSKSSIDKALVVLNDKSVQIDRERRVLSIQSKGISMVKTTLHQFEEANIQVENISMHRPTLDDVFLTLTGHTATTDSSDKSQQEKEL